MTEKTFRALDKGDKVLQKSNGKWIKATVTGWHCGRLCTRDEQGSCGPAKAEFLKLANDPAWVLEEAK